MSKRYRNWVFTLNNYTSDEELSIQRVGEDHAKFLLYGRERGESGTPHLQGMVVWQNAKTLAATKKTLSRRAHLEVMAGTPQQSIIYCSKDNDVWSCGQRPKEPSEVGADEKRRWQEAIQFAKEGSMDLLEEHHPDIYMRYYGTIKRIRKDNPPELERLSGLDNHWFHGPPGTGKSYTARELFGDSLYIKNTNKWWDGYRNEDTILIEELELDAKYMGHFLKVWADVYPFQAEIKGGAIMARPQRIVITSNYTIDEIFHEDRMLASAIKRRFNSRPFLIKYTTNNSIN